MTGKELDSESTYENNYGIHIKSKADEGRTYFHHNRAPNKNTNYRCLAQIKVESISRTNALKYYPQVYLEDCKYEI